MEGIGSGFGTAMLIVGVIVFTWGLFTGELFDIGRSRKIVSPTRIEPEIKLVLKNNQVDTTYVYKLK